MQQRRNTDFWPIKHVILEIEPRDFLTVFLSFDDLKVV